MFITLMPTKIIMYKLALTLFKVYNERMPQFEWLNLNFTQILTTRQENFLTLNIPRYKVGNNILTNRFAILNNMIPLLWLNLGFDSFKIKCKKLFLNWNVSTRKLYHLWSWSKLHVGTTEVPVHFIFVILSYILLILLHI